MHGSSSKCSQVLAAPALLQSFVCHELMISLQASGQDHFGPVVCTELQGQSRLGKHFAMQRTYQRLRSSRLLLSAKSHNLQVFVLFFLG